MKYCSPSVNIVNAVSTSPLTHIVNNSCIQHVKSCWQAVTSICNKFHYSILFPRLHLLLFPLSFCFSASVSMPRLSFFFFSSLPPHTHTLELFMIFSWFLPVISCRLCYLSPWWIRACAPGEQCWSMHWAATPAWEKWTWVETAWTTLEPKCSAKPCRSTQRSGEGNNVGNLGDFTEFADNTQYVAGSSSPVKYCFVFSLCHVTTTNFSSFYWNFFVMY